MGSLQPESPPAPRSRARTKTPVPRAPPVGAADVAGLGMAKAVGAPPPPAAKALPSHPAVAAVAAGTLVPPPVVVVPQPQAAESPVLVKAANPKKPKKAHAIWGWLKAPWGPGGVGA